MGRILPSLLVLGVIGCASSSAPSIVPSRSNGVRGIVVQSELPAHELVAQTSAALEAEGFEVVDDAFGIVRTGLRRVDDVLLVRWTVRVRPEPFGSTAVFQGRYAFSDRHAARPSPITEDRMKDVRIEDGPGQILFRQMEDLADAIGGTGKMYLR